VKNLELPSNPLRRYTEIYEALSADRKWYQGALGYRFAALTLATTRGHAESIAESLHLTAEKLKKRAGWLGPLTSPVRFVVGAILLRSGDDPDDFCDEVERVRGLFRKHDLPRGGVYEAVATLLMGSHRTPVKDVDVIRFKAMYQQMKKHHWWLTGVGDYPYCAAFAVLDEPVAEISERVERLYALLQEAGCSRGDPLQRVSHMLYLNPKPEEQIVARFVELREAVKEAGTKIYQSDWDELALLTFCEASVPQIVGETLAFRDAMLELKPGVGRWVAFTLGSSIAFLKLTGGKGIISDAKAIEDFQHILQAQQAGAAAGAAAAAT